MDTKGIKSISIANADIQKIVVGGGIVWQGNTIPGPTTLKGGNLQAGFYGEVPASELITGDELAQMIGLTAGHSQFSTEPWLKFSYMGKIEFVAKKPFRHSISWYYIKSINAVYGNRLIKIGKHTYKIRLMKGKTEGKQSDVSETGGYICKGSEWNKLMLPVHINAPSNWKNPENVNNPTENWNVGYTDSDLLTHFTLGEGTFSLCQEYGHNYYSCIARGRVGVSASASPSNDSAYYENGWRPVLELVD